MKVILIGIEFVSRKCPGCGANLELAPESERGRCDYCGASFILTASGEGSVINAKSGKVQKYNDQWVLRLTDPAVKRFMEEHKIDLSEDPAAMKRISEAALKASIELEKEDEVTMNIPFIVQDFSKPLHICEEYTRSDMM